MHGGLSPVTAVKCQHLAPAQPEYLNRRQAPPRLLRSDRVTGYVQGETVLFMHSQANRDSRPHLIEAVELGALAQVVVEGEWDDTLMTQVQAPSPIPA